jgi:SAM-dependent methyltransferase
MSLIYKVSKRLKNKARKLKVWRKYKLFPKKIREISKQNIEPKNEYVTRVKTYKTYKEYIYNQMEKTSRPETREMCEKIRKERIDEFYKMFKKTLKFVNDTNYALCIGARYGEESEAAKKIFDKVEAIDLVECPPLVKIGDMHNLEFPNKTFDLVYTNSLDHSFNPHRVIEECYRVLKPKGILVVDIKYKDKGIYEVIRFDDKIKFKKLFSSYFELAKEENLINREILFGLSNRYFWRKD